LIESLEQLLSESKEFISSSRLSEISGIPAHTIRKDVGFLSHVKSRSTGYNIKDLKSVIIKDFDLSRERNICVVGLGNLGTAILNYPQFDNYKITAGFDNNINKIELLNTKIELFPAYAIEEIVKERDIELAILTIPASAVQITVERLEKGGIKGIINFAPVSFHSSNKNFFVKNVSVLEELKILSSSIFLKK